MDVLAKAEQGHLPCREAAVLARNEKFKDAEENATRGVNELKESVLEVPCRGQNNNKI